MATVSASQEVQTPPERIWALLDDFHRMPEYVHFMREVFDCSAPPVRVGSKYSERSKPGPVEAVSHWTVTAVEPLRRQVHETHMPDFEAVLTVTLEPAGSGTRYTQTTEFRFLPKLRPVGAAVEALFMRRLMQRHMERIVGTIKRLAESAPVEQDSAPSTEAILG